MVGLIGAGIGQSLSPALHEREAALLGFDYAYRLLDLDELGRPASDVGAMVREAQREGLRGLNVTHPCKQLVVAELDELSPEAAALGAVNTIVFRDGRTTGYNTDLSGFQEAFERRAARREHRPRGAPRRGRRGRGRRPRDPVPRGRSRGRPRRRPRARRRAGRGGSRGTSAPARPARPASTRWRGELARADGLVHATPTGMDAHPGTAVPAELLDPRLWVAEVVYLPIETQLLQDARARGCRTLDGAAMVALQAAGSLERFTGARPDRDRMLDHVDELIAARASASGSPR